MSISPQTHSAVSPAGQVPPAPSFALRHAPSHMRLWIVTVVGLAVDLWTKHEAFSRLDWQQPTVLVKNLCSLQLSLNPGALFGIGAGFAAIVVGASVLALMLVLYLFASSDSSRWSLHVALGLVLAGALGNLYDRVTQQAYVVHDSGDGRRAIGTLVERDDSAGGIWLGDFPTGENARWYRNQNNPLSGPQPVVRDFIKFEITFPKSIPWVGGWALWPWIFNIADALLVVGVAILILNFLHDHRTANKTGMQQPRLEL